VKQLAIRARQRCADEIVHDRQGESGSLSGTGLGETDQIPSGESERYGLLLDGRWVRIPRIAHGVQHLGGEIQLRKRDTGRRHDADGLSRAVFTHAFAI
jgi:hypothetical protein